MLTQTSTETLLQNTLHGAGQSFMTAAASLFTVLALAAALLLTVAWLTAELTSRRTQTLPADPEPVQEDAEPARSWKKLTAPAL